MHNTHIRHYKFQRWSRLARSTDLTLSTSRHIVWNSVRLPEIWIMIIAGRDRRTPDIRLSDQSAAAGRSGTGLSAQTNRRNSGSLSLSWVCYLYVTSEEAMKKFRQSLLPLITVEMQIRSCFYSAHSHTYMLSVIIIKIWRCRLKTYSLRRHRAKNQRYP